MVFSLIDGDLHCFNCGEILLMSKLGRITLDMMAVIGEQFGEEHRHCQLTEAGTACRAEHERKFAELESNKTEPTDVST